MNSPTNGLNTDAPAGSMGLDRRLLLGAAGLAGIAALSRASHAGPLNPPPGPITSTTPAIGDARTNVNALPGNAAAVHVISQPGSYYLTANINVPAGKSGIVITASNVSLDLNGFAIRGVDGSQHGIRANPAPAPDHINNVSICNGLIQNVDSDAVNAADQCTGLRVDGVSAHDCGAGFYVWQAVVTRCHALNCGNGFTGYETNFVACGANNCGTGFSLSNCRAGECAANFCSNGFDLGGGSMISDAQVSGGWNGAFLRERCTVRNCHFSECGNSGIEVWGDFGPSGKWNFIEGNTFVRCGVGVRCNGPDTSHNLIIANRAIDCGSGPGDGFLFTTSNRIGPLIDANTAAAGNLSTVGGSNHPLANITY